jgi:hypothetical protein
MTQRFIHEHLANTDAAMAWANSEPTIDDLIDEWEDDLEDVNGFSNDPNGDDQGDGEKYSEDDDE